jgi:hypothetical protein
MKLLVLIALLAAASAACAQPKPAWEICRNPVRVFHGQGTVDLTPLFQWWAHQPLATTNRGAAGGDSETNQPDADRPLAGWLRVTGRKAGVIDSSWVVEAVIYTSPTEHTNARVILENPPAVEEARFNTLKAELAAAEQQMAEMRREYRASTNAEATARTEAGKYARYRTRWAEGRIAAYTRLADQKENAAAAALAQTVQLEEARKEIEAELRLIPSNNGVYQVDWFAVRRGVDKHGVPIFDLGLVRPTPP